MPRSLSIAGALLVALDLVAAAALILRRDTGDAATRGVGQGIGGILAALGIIAAFLLWTGRTRQGPALTIAGLALAAVPVALTLTLTLKRQGLALIYPSLRERDVPREASPRYAFPDAAGREAALALVYNDYAKLDSILHATPAPDLTAHDERGVSLVGLATRTSIMDGGSMRDLDGLRFLLAAGARPRPDDLGPDEESLLELVSRARGERAALVLGMLLEAGLDPNAPMRDGRPILLLPTLTPDAARILLAHGVDREGRDRSGARGDWSPVTYQADLRNWATALALLDGGVAPDHGTPPGSVLARVLSNGEARTTDEERADSAYVTFRARVSR